MYKIPDQYYFRLHQIRPRFKNNIENVLLYVASEISKLERQPLDSFNKSLFDAIRLYAGNATKTNKTINNWRTEISALFGFIEEDNINKKASTGMIAQKLANEQDLVQFFKYFLFYFQYPGGHIKPHKLKNVIDANIKFKPAQYFLKVLQAGESHTNKRFYINKTEARHFIYDDLRVTRDNCKPLDVVQRIIQSRHDSYKLDWHGDIVRYAGDILDYMTIGDLLIQHGNKFYINWRDKKTIAKFIKSDVWFSKYDSFYEENFSVNDLKPIKDMWFQFVNKDLGQNLFKTDIVKYLEIEENTYTRLVDTKIEKFDHDNVANTKEIGDFGEHLIVGHESMKIKSGGRKDLLHLIKNIPTSLAAGYDILSVELDERKRYIEVKTTISNKPLTFSSFHLTTNEWVVAEGLDDAYFIYRLMVSKHERKLFILKNPVKKYKNDQIRMIPRNGADIIFTEQSGEWEELLIWKK